MVITADSHLRGLKFESIRDQRVALAILLIFSFSSFLLPGPARTQHWQLKQHKVTRRLLLKRARRAGRGVGLGESAG